MKPSELSRVIVDTTVQPKNITFPTEAKLMADSLQEDFGVTVRWQEGRSRTTWENAQFTAELLQPLGLKRVVVVTQAWHMPRSVWSFEAAGLSVEDLPALWHADSTTPQDRQTIARLLLEQVTVTVEGNSDRVEVELRWAGGFLSRHTLSRPVQTYKQLSRYDELVAGTDALARVAAFCGLSDIDTVLANHRKRFDASADDKWQRALSPADIQTINAVAGPVLRETGYLTGEIS